MDQNAKQQIIDRLKQANNILITVSNNPSVDQLAACIGFTLVVNKLGKHGTAVFSGQVPSTIEFLKPEDTIERNTDSLRDFIIALDKSKADKLRYKVEDKVVKIFITPYRTSITDKDLDFSQGDFNVDAVLALGVHERTELDQAIVAHGRILHDATVISINNREQGNLGTINWVDLNSSSLSEMLIELSKGLTADPFDGQMATAFMTGIVAETKRFSNDKTSPRTMTLASELMTAGANQQLIASKLEAPQPIPKTEAQPAEKAEEPVQDAVVNDDGSLKITHETGEKAEEVAAPKDDTSEPPDVLPPVAEETTQPVAAVPEPAMPPTPPVEPPAPAQPPAPQISKLHDDKELPDTPPAGGVAAQFDNSIKPSDAMALQPPSRGGTLTASSTPEHLQTDGSTDPLSATSNLSAGSPGILNRSPANIPFSPSNDITSSTLNNIEAAVGSPHQAGQTAAPAADVLPQDNLDEARDAVANAVASTDSGQPLAPIAALGAQPVNLPLGPDSAAPPAAPAAQATPPATPDFTPPSSNGVNPNIPPSLMPTTPPVDTSGISNPPSAPPPVPPPMMPPAS